MKAQAIKHEDAILLLRSQARKMFMWGVLAGIGIAGTTLFAALAIAVWWYV